MFQPATRARIFGAVRWTALRILLNSCKIRTKFKLVIFVRILYEFVLGNILSFSYCGHITIRFLI